MLRIIALAGAAATAAGVFLGGAGDDETPAYPSLPTMPQTAEVAAQSAPFAPASMAAPVPAGSPEDSIYQHAALAAWRFLDSHHAPATGLIAAQPTWAYPTVWDIGSTLGAYFSANRLGFLEDAEYERRVRALLGTMLQARLYEGIAYGRNYDYRTGELVGNDQEPSENGTGYSAIDQGRLLVWLRIIALDLPDVADEAAQVAARLDESRILMDGYMHGKSVTDAGELLEFQEGRIGYEQYSATGFGLWDMRAERALRLEENAVPATVLGVPITGDRRGLDRLTSEPLILAGMELGWSAGLRELALQTLAAQVRRHEETGQITIASEDAVGVPPHYFYYYCVYCSGEPFTINVHAPGTSLDEPRWISTKSAFAWHALLPSQYTWSAVEAVLPALDPSAGWASGVFEGSGESTATPNLNTSAVILESALYRQLRRPFIEVAAAD